MSSPKDPSDAPFIPSMGSSLSDPSDVDSDMPGTPVSAPERAPEDPVAMAKRLAAEAKAARAQREADEAAMDAPEDPKTLAKRLAEEAKQRAAAAKQAAEAEDPKALAKRLAQEAKQKAAAAKQSEDPKALAKRLAEEAKRKAAAAKQAAEAEDPKALAKRLAQEAKQKADAARSAQKAKAEEPKDLMSRVGKPRVKRRSAAEILAAARAAEEQAQAKAKAKARKPAQAKPASTPAPAPTPEPEPAPAKAVDPESAITQVLSGATIIAVKRPGSTDVLKAVWSAHLARAQASDDLELAVAASALLGALDRVGAQGLAAAEVRFSGNEHAVFIELATGALICAARPAHVYLAGA